MKTHAMPEGPDLPSSAALAASFNHALEPKSVGPSIMTITDNITSPASVTRRFVAVAQLGRSPFNYGC